MTTLRQTIRRARRRLLAHRCLHGAGQGLAVGALAAIGLLIADRLLALDWSLAVFGAVLALA